MTESKATEKAIEFAEKHFVPLDKRDDYEWAFIQCVGDFYRAGFEIVPVFKPNVGLGDIQRMADEKVIY